MQGADDGDLGGAADFGNGVVDDDHGAIGEVSDGLVVFFSRADEGDADALADGDGGFEGFVEFVDVENVHALEVGDLGEVFVHGHEPGAEQAGGFDEA